LPGTFSFANRSIFENQNSSLISRHITFARGFMLEDNTQKDMGQLLAALSDSLTLQFRMEVSILIHEHFRGPYRHWWFEVPIGGILVGFYPNRAGKKHAHVCQSILNFVSICTEEAHVQVEVFIFIDL
jgi:hypothetical protein